MSKPETIIKWQEYVNNWRISGLTQYQYCTLNKISRSDFSKWNKKLSQDNNTQTSFVKISPSSTNNINKNAELNLTIYGKYTISITEGFNKSLLKDVISAIKELAC